MVLTKKHFDNRVPPLGEPSALDKEAIAEAGKVKGAVEKNLEGFHFREAQKEAMNLARIGNKYLADAEPWKTAKSDMERTATILNIALQITANLSIVIEPFLPFSAAKLRRFLGVDTLSWEKLGSFELLPEGHALGKPGLLFEKIDDEVIEKQVQKLHATKELNEEASKGKESRVRESSGKASEGKESLGGRNLGSGAGKEQEIAQFKEPVEFEAFEKLDIRVGTVLECEKVPKADKLLRFLLDDGIDTRTILSGIAEYYPDPRELVGKQVCFIANLAPRKMRGILSEGMILSAENSDGTLSLVSPSKELNPGSRVT